MELLAYQLMKSLSSVPSAFVHFHLLYFVTQASPGVYACISKRK